MAYNAVLHGLIRNAGLTQKKFADAIDVNPAQMSLLITGDIKRIGWKDETTMEKMEKIAKFFNKPIEEIFGGVK